LEFSQIRENVLFINETVGTFDVSLCDEREIEESAYKLYWDYNCEYAIITAFNEKASYPLSYDEVLEIKEKLPFNWRAICGALTGAFFILSTTLPQKSSVKAVEELISFHNETPLPLSRGRFFKELPKVAVGSVLCRDSIVNWCKKAGISPRSLERSERCALITADVAVKTVQLIKKYSLELVKD